MEARRSLLIVLNNVLGAALGMVGLFFIGRTMDPAALGMVVFALSLIGMGDVTANLGLRQAHIKRLSEGLDPDTCNGTFARLKLLATTATVLTGLAGITLWHQWNGFADATTFAVLLVMIVHFSILQGRALWVTTFAGFRQAAQTERIAFTDTAVRVAATIFVAVVVAGMTGARGLQGLLGDLPARIADALGAVGGVTRDDAALWLAGTFVLGAAASLLVAIVTGHRAGFRFGRYDPELARGYFRFGLPLALTAAAGVLANRLDAVMIGYFWSAGQVGLYYAGQRLAGLVTMVPLAVGMIFFPLISEMALRRDVAKVHAAALRAQRILSLVVVPLVLCLVLLGRPTLHILVGDAFLGAAPIVALLAVNALLLSYTIVANTVAKGYDRPGLAARTGIVVMGGNALLNLVFIPDSILGVQMLGWKAMGAAVATATAQAMGVLYVHAATRPLMRGGIVGWYALRQGAAAVTVAALYRGLARATNFEVDRVWELAGVGALIALSYVALLVVLREWRSPDTRFFRELLHPGKMVEYVRSEVARDAGDVASDGESGESERSAEARVGKRGGGPS